MKKAVWLVVVAVLLVGVVGVGFAQVLPEIPRTETLIVDNLHGRVGNPAILMYGYQDH